MRRIERVYDAARKDESVRQEFLELLDYEEYTPWIEQVKYTVLGWYGNSVKIPEDLRTNTLMITGSLHPSDLKKTGRSALIVVTQNAFEQIPKFKEFISSLLDHEGFHAKEMFEDPDCIYYKSKQKRFDAQEGRNPDDMYELWRCMCEKRATENQLRNAARRNLSHSAIQRLQKIVDTYTKEEKEICQIYRISPERIREAVLVKGCPKIY